VREIATLNGQENNRQAQRCMAELAAGQGNGAFLGNEAVAGKTLRGLLDKTLRVTGT